MQRHGSASSLYAVHGGSVLPGGRSRSASPSRHALAVDMKRIANLLRESQPDGGGSAVQASPDNRALLMMQAPAVPPMPGMASSPQVPAGASCIAASLQFPSRKQYGALGERLNVMLSELQQKGQEDQRILTQLAERPLVDIDQCQAENTVQVQHRKDVEHQIHSLEDQAHSAALEGRETRKRQSAKIRHAEHAVDDIARRLKAAEAELRAQRESPFGADLRARVDKLEQRHGHLDVSFDGFHVDLGRCLQDVGALLAKAEVEPPAHIDNPDPLEDATRSAKRGLAELERKVFYQLDELTADAAKLHVKCDGQASRLQLFTERLEIAHEPAIQALRAEFDEVHAKGMRELEGEISALRQCARSATEANDEANAEVCSAVECLRAELAPSTEAFDERLAVVETLLRDAAGVAVRHRVAPRHGKERRQASVPIAASRSDTSRPETSRHEVLQPPQVLATGGSLQEVAARDP